MGKINGHDVLADNSDEYEEDGSRYDSVIPPELRRSHSELGGEGGGESAGVRPGANSPGLGGRPPLDEENTGFEFGFLAGAKVALVAGGSSPALPVARTKMGRFDIGRGFFLNCAWECPAATPYNASVQAVLSCRTSRRSIPSEARHDPPLLACVVCVVTLHGRLVRPGIGRCRR
jgi:hypothetical protein